MIWYVPDIANNYKPYWYLAFYCLFTISLSVSKTFSNKLSVVLFQSSFFVCCVKCLHVPYTALTVHVASDQNERDSATYFSKSYRKPKEGKKPVAVEIEYFFLGITFELIGVVLAGLIQGIVISIYSEAYNCTAFLNETSSLRADSGSGGLVII
jgi:hypothetical protein